MNKFAVCSCLSPEEHGTEYQGCVLPLINVLDQSLVLSFPINEEQAHTVNFVLDSGGDDINEDSQLLGIYKTMIESWKASGKYLAGIYITSKYSQEKEDDLIIPQLIICSEDGAFDGMVRVNFVHAMLLAAIEKVYITVDKDLLKSLIPDLFEDEEQEASVFAEEDKLTELNHEKQFPVDPDLDHIVRDILEGKTKDKNK